MRRYITTPMFRRLLADGDQDIAQASTLVKFVPFERTVDESTGTVDIIASTGDRDRYGDRVSVKGWQLKNFKRNPVILWAHEHGIAPVGRATKVWTDKEALHKRVEFTPADLYPFGHMIGEMVRQGFLSAASVGFQASKWAPTKAAGDEDMDELTRLFPGAVDFLKHDLMESSIVTVPANTEALVSARAAGVDTSPMVEVAERMLDDETEAGPVLNRDWYERAYAQTREDKTIVALSGALPEASDEEKQTTIGAEDMSAQARVEEARKLLTTAKSAAAEIGNDLETVITDACSEIETCLRDCDELGVALGAETLARFGALAKAFAAYLPTPEPAAPAQESVETKAVDDAPSAEDLAMAVKHLESGLRVAIEAALDQRTGRLSD